MKEKTKFLVDLRYAAEDEPPVRILARSWNAAVALVLEGQADHGPVTWARLEQLEEAR